MAQLRFSRYRNSILLFGFQFSRRKIIKHKIDMREDIIVNLNLAKICVGVIETKIPKN